MQSHSGLPQVSPEHASHFARSHLESAHISLRYIEAFLTFTQQQHHKQEETFSAHTLLMHPFVCLYPNTTRSVCGSSRFSSLEFPPYSADTFITVFIGEAQTWGHVETRRQAATA